ncbi:unnamed protein product, partial [Rotaria sp. Silwood2]
MVESKNSADLIDTTSDVLSYLSLSMEPNIKYRPMLDPLSVYVPLESLTEETIDSIVSTVQQSNKKDWNHSKRTLLAFLLSINNKVTEIERQDSKNTFDRQISRHAAKVRQWLVEKDHSGNIKKVDWDELRKTYDKMAKEKDDGMAKYFGVTNAVPYYELTIEGLHPDINQSREYMNHFRSHGWEPNELKIYWNVQQIENLCPKHETQPSKQVEETDQDKNNVNSETEVEPQCEPEHTRKDTTKIETKLEKNEETKDEATVEVKSENNNEVKEQMKDEPNKETKAENLPPHDPSDVDVVQALREHPVSKRNNSRKITYVNKGIEKAVFDIPEDAQIILLNFANERSTGGGYLRHAWAQEEIILYNSDGYRSLLDLKYGRMSGGYAIPEFGLAY